MLDWIAANLAKRIRPARPALVHAHFGWAAPLAAELADELDIPLVCTFHASDVTVWPTAPASEGGVSPSYAQVFARLDHAFVVSNYIANQLHALGWRGPTDIVPAGVRLDLFAQRTVAPPTRPTRLLYVGRLVERKGLDVLLRALPSLVDARPDLVLDVIGDGSQREGYEALARHVLPEGSVRFLGARGRNDVRDALAGAHVVVVPSRSMPTGEVEGSPVIVKEALAVGVPVVATRNGGTPEVVPPPYRHELVPENDPVALADQIRSILDGADSWPARAVVGREWVEREFDWAVLAKRTAATYAEVVTAARR